LGINITFFAIVSRGKALSCYEAATATSIQSQSVTDQALALADIRRSPSWQELSAPSASAN